MRPESLFLSKAVRWHAGIKRGFIVRPHEEGTGDSWGTPYKDAEGNLIVPGTPGGPYDRAFLGIKDGRWLAIRRDTMQEAGNLDWKGDWTSPAMDKRRVVTFNGPTQRYWNSGAFVYGSSQTHQYVYSEGLIVGVAPLPVLGACIHVAEESVEVEPGIFATQSRTWIIAVCKDGDGNDIVYGTTQRLALRSEDVTEEVMTRVTLVGDGSADPDDGWLAFAESSGYTDGVDTVPPEAPWFFDTTGTYARTMRRATYSHSENGTAGPFEDQLYRELRLKVQPDKRTAAFTLVEDAAAAQRNNEWTCTVQSLYDLELYTQLAGESEDGYSHEFEERWCETKMRMWGTAKLCVDYDPDTEKWLYGWADGTLWRNHGQEWTTGIDEANTTAEDTGGRVPNTGYDTGPQPVPNNYVPTWRDHYKHQWFGTAEAIDLVVSPAVNRSQLAAGTDERYRITVQWGNSGDSTEQAGGEPDPDDPYFAFWDSYNTWIHYFDIRSGLIAGTLYTGLLEAEGDTVRLEDVEWAGVQGNPFDLPSLPGEITDSYFFMRHETQPVRSFPGQYPTMWTFADTETWPYPVDEFGEYTNYSATFTPANSDGSDYEPYWQQAYPVWLENEFPQPLWMKVSLIEMLYNRTYVDVDGIFGSTEMGEHLVYLEYFNKVERDNVGESYSWNIDGDPIETLKGGDRMSPGGLV